MVKMNYRRSSMKSHSKKVNKKEKHDARKKVLNYQSEDVYSEPKIFKTKLKTTQLSDSVTWLKRKQNINKM